MTASDTVCFEILGMGWLGSKGSWVLWIFPRSWTHFRCGVEDVAGNSAFGARQSFGASFECGICCPGGPNSLTASTAWNMPGGNLTEWPLTEFVSLELCVLPSYRLFCISTNKSGSLQHATPKVDSATCRPNDLWGIHDLLLAGYAGIFMEPNSKGWQEAGKLLRHLQTNWKHATGVNKSWKDNQETPRTEGCQTLGSQQLYMKELNGISWKRQKGAE